MIDLLKIIFTPEFLFSVLRVTTPILFASLGAMISNKSGAINIGIEGLMLIAAFTGVVGSAFTGSAWLGFLFSLFCGFLITALLAYFVLSLKTDFVLGGIALNILATGGTIFALYYLTGDKGTSASLASKTLPDITLPLIDKIPYIGEAISGHNILTYLAFIMVFVVHYMMNKTKLGLRIRAVGESEDAAKSVGVNVFKTKFIAFVLSGLLASAGGAFLSMGYVSWFSRDMSAGRGWIALAAEAMGRGNVLGTTLSSILFGAADALSNHLQMFNVPSEIVRTIPYIATVVALVIYALRRGKRK